MDMLSHGILAYPYSANQLWSISSSATGECLHTLATVAEEKFPGIGEHTVAYREPDGVDSRSTPSKIAAILKSET